MNGAADMPEANELTVGIMALVAQQEREGDRRDRRGARSARCSCSGLFRQPIQGGVPARLGRDAGGKDGPALAEGRAVAAAMDAIARQPEAANTISRTLFVGLAMIETMAIYCLVIALLVLFQKAGWKGVWVDGAHRRYYDKMPNVSKGAGLETRIAGLLARVNAAATGL